MSVGERIVEAAQVFTTGANRKPRRLRGVACELGEVSETPGSRGKQGLVAPAHGDGAHCPSTCPDREHKWLSRPALPLFAEVIAVRIGAGGRKLERRISNHQDGFVRERSQSVEVLGFSTCFGEFRLDLPDISAEQLEQCN